MKSLEEIKQYRGLIVNQVGIDGGNGFIHIGTWDGTVVWSDGGGWDHVSVCPLRKRIIPSWDDMCRLKDIFFDDQEAAIQIHPQKSEYVNNMPNCLHLWKYQGDFPLPPAWMVGIRNGEDLQGAMEYANSERDVVR